MTGENRRRLARALLWLHLPQAPKTWGFFLLHHWLAAATLASAVLGLELWGKLEWLDAAMLRIVSPSSSNMSGKDLPQLVLIDAETYAERFQLRSPLDRERLVEIVGDMLAAHPTTLVVDLQLEPGPGRKDNGPLDRLFTAAAQDPAGATRIILPLPERRTPVIDRAALEWVRSLCHAGITFGSADLTTHFGAVLRANARGTLAALAVEPVQPDAELLTGKGEPPRVAGATACHRADQVSNLAELSGAEPESEAESHTELLAPGALRNILANAMPWRPSLTRAVLAGHPPRIVVLGGDFDERDRFYTTARGAPVPGAAVHAGAIASHGLIAASPWWGWCVDIAVGTLLGAVFVALWGAASHAKPVKLEGGAERYSQREIVLFALQTTVALSAAAGVWLVALAIAWSFMKAAASLMALGAWLNPGPMVLGMFLHAMLLKDGAHSGVRHAENRAVSGEHHETHDQTHGDPATLRAFAIHAPAWLAQLVVVASAVMALFMFHG